MTSEPSPRATRLLAACLVALIATAVAGPRPVFSQPAGGPSGDARVAMFAREWPELFGRLVALERAHGVFYGALTAGRAHSGQPAVPAAAKLRMPVPAAPRPRTPLDEAEVFRARMTRRAGAASLDRPDPEAERGYASLGARAAAVLTRGAAFHREMLAVFATVPAAARTAALDDAVARYLSRPELSLPDSPKDMTILYDHDFTSFTEEGFNPRRVRPYPSLNGFVWAARWFQLAAQEPLELADDAAGRVAGVQTVTERFERKLQAGKLPDAFPTELPLAPSIAPGLVTAHERAAAIVDNLSLLNDVIADILVHPKATNTRAAIDKAVTLFTDRSARSVEVDEWIKMALRHSIFEQGGPALMVMLQSDRNGNGHAQHARSGRAIPPGGMR